MDIDLKQLKELMRSLKSYDVTELEIEENGSRVRLVRQGQEVAAQGHIGGTNVTITPQLAAAPMMSAGMPTPSQAPAAAPSAAAADAAATSVDDPSAHYITSPFVGTFYASPSPDADAFVKVGSKIAPGEPLCIVEAMKLMNEIESEVSGEILEVLASNGKPVEYGDRLFKVKKV